MAGANGRRKQSESWRIAADIGGTFTDVILVGPREAVTLKVLSTPPDFERGVIDALERGLGFAGLAPGDLSAVLHGTTVPTNAILESRGARTALVTTRGFRDVLELGRLRRPRLYDLSWEKPRPLVPRRLRLELTQRITSRGELDPPFDPRELDGIVDQLASNDVEAVAICLINSHLRQDEERRVAARLAERLPGVFVTASVDVSPEMKEYERTSTAVVNAYLGPVVGAYIASLHSGLGRVGVDAPFQVMQSSGGLLDAQAAVARPVNLIESGPAAGVIGVQKLAAAMGLPSVIAFDMGGTTAKASLIENGQPFVAQQFEVGGGMNLHRGLSGGAGYAVRVPSIDIAEIGAGGGSVIWVDDGGAVKVGPESAGARPGPACYGLGGRRPTLTDANVVLGYLSPVALAGGNVPISPELADEAIGSVARVLGIDPVVLAYGAYTIAATSMTKAVKAVTSERGRDPRASTLVAFGGAGPLYAAAIARELGISTVIVPAHPGLFSALGLLVADLEHHEVRAWSHDRDGLEAVERSYQELERVGRASLAANGAAPAFDRLADMRYRGQRYELRIPAPAGPFDEAALAELRHRFHEEHSRTYGRRGSDHMIELVNLRVRCFLPNRANVLEMFAGNGHAPAAATSRMRRGYFPDVGYADIPVVGREQVSASGTSGPLIVEDMDATTVVPPGALCVRDAVANLHITWPAQEAL